MIWLRVLVEKLVLGQEVFLRTLVDILDKSQMYDNYVPVEQFVFNDEIRIMAETVENTAAHIVNF